MLTLLVAFDESVRLLLGGSTLSKMVCKDILRAAINPIFLEVY